MEREELRKELKLFAQLLVDGYMDDTTILEILGTDDCVDDYVDNQLKERWIKLPTSEQVDNDTLLAIGIVFKKTNLGEAVFIHIKDEDASNSVRPDNWTPTQLRLMADYMEANPNCTLFEDGSGNPCC